MKSPNETNLDEWLFRYFEGDLNADDEKLLEDFLLDHPEYDAQFEAWGASRIEVQPVAYPRQNELRKPLVPFTTIHKVAVFTAIAINAALASMIIWDNNSVESNYDFVAITPSEYQNSIKPFSASTLENTTQIPTSLPVKTVFSPYNASKTTLSASAREVRVQSGGVSYQSDAYNGSENAITNVSATRTDNHEGPSLQGDLTDVISHQYVIEEVLNIAGQENTPMIASHQTTSNEHISAEESESVEKENAAFIVEHNSTNSSLNTNKETSNNRDSRISDAKSKESNSREKKFGSRTDRFIGGGELLLTNTRTQEYLIPGANRNTINFGNVAADFANSAYSNTYLQYPSKENQLLVSQLGYDLFIPQIRSGLGLMMNYSTYGNGAIRDFETAVTFSPKFVLGKGLTLEPALRLKMSSTGVDRTMIQPNAWIEFDRGNSFQYSQNQYDAFISRSIQQDMGLGLLLNSKWGFIGANADNLFGSWNQALHYEQALSSKRSPVFFNAVLGTEYEALKTKTLFSTQLIYQNYGALNKLWLGGRIKHKYLSLGASVSSLGEPLFSAGFVSKNLSVLYSGDYSYSRILNDKYLSHQLLIRITLKESRLKKLLLN